VGKIKVLIADDHSLFREGLRKLLESTDGLEVVTEVGDGQGAINIARKKALDVILMDINMPGTDGILATQVIKREFPHVHIIALTIYEGEEVVQMVKAGVSAYILKDVAGSELIDTIYRVMSGEIVINSRVANHLVKELTQTTRKKDDLKLSKREKDVLLLLVRGLSNREMAKTMFISEKTIKNHLTSIFRKLGVKDRTQAAIYALKHEIVSDESNSLY
jgi:DNA-binding NarL/FixJ family response regulator